MDVLVQDKRNSIANALELRLYCANPSILVVSSKRRIAGNGASYVSKEAY